MTQALAAPQLTRPVMGRHEVRDPQTGQLVAWINPDLDRVDRALRQALMLNGLLLVSAQHTD